MAMRSTKERAIQTLAFEAGGIVIATPLYNVAFGATAAGSFALLIALSIAVVIWSAFHNLVFDQVEWRLAGRIASDRPHHWRLTHAISHEVTAVAVTLPLVIWLGGHELPAALMVNLGLTAVYTACAYLFHIVFDRLRPVKR